MDLAHELKKQAQDAVVRIESLADRWEEGEITDEEFLSGVRSRIRKKKTLLLQAKECLQKAGCPIPKDD